MNFITCFCSDFQRTFLLFFDIQIYSFIFNYKNNCKKKHEKIQQKIIFIFVLN